MGRTVLLDGYRHFVRNRIDRQPAIHDNKRNVREVSIGVPEIIHRQLHRVEALVRAACARRAAEREVVHGVQRVADACYGVAGHGLLCAVVGVGRAVLRDGNDHFRISRVNRQAAVHNFERYVGKVLVLVLKVACRERHRVEALARAAHARRAVEREVAFGIQRIADVCYGVAGHGLLCAVVGMGRAVLRDGNNDFTRDGVNRQPAILNYKLHVGEIRVLVREVACIHLHRVEVRFRAAHACRAAERKVVHGVQRVADALYGVAGHSLLCAVVGVGRAVFLDGNGDFIGNRVDGQPAILNYKLHVGEIRVLVREVACIHLHRVEVRFRAAHACRAAERKVVHGVQRVADALYGVAGHGLLCAVIGVGRAVFLDGNGDFARNSGNRQLAGGLCHSIVPGYIGIAVHDLYRAAERAVVLVCVLALRAVGKACIGVAFKQSVLRDAVDLLLGTGVGLRRAFAGEGHGALVNRERTGHLGDGILRGYIDAIAQNFHARDDIVVRFVVSYVGYAAGNGHIKRVACLERAGQVITAVHKRRAVIGLAVALRGDGDRRLGNVIQLDHAAVLNRSGDGCRVGMREHSVGVVLVCNALLCDGKRCGWVEHPNFFLNGHGVSRLERIIQIMLHGVGKRLSLGFVLHIIKGDDVAAAVIRECGRKRISTIILVPFKRFLLNIRLRNGEGLALIHGFVLHLDGTEGGGAVPIIDHVLDPVADHGLFPKLLIIERDDIL